MKKKVVIFLVVGVLVLGLGISLAYFTPIITGNGKEISLVAKELKVIYTDTSAIQPGIIEPNWHISKTFTVENKSDGLYKYNIVLEDLVNTFETEGYLQYKIISDTGFNCEWTNVPKTTEPADTILAYSVEIADKAIQRYTIEFQYLETEEDQSADMGRSFNGNIMISEGTLNIPPFLAKLLEDNKDIKTRDNFSTVYTGTAGLYKEDNLGYLEEDGNTQDIVYYFVGNPDNNWVKFGEYNGQDIWWRIIRTNEDGSVRLLYAEKGTTGYNSTTGYIGNSKYNTSYSDTMYVGYMYGTTGSLEKNREYKNDSEIKTTIDTWYENKLLSEYDSYLSKTAIYCNDRTTYNYQIKNDMYYGAAMRLTLRASSADYGGVTSVNDYHPTFKCGGDNKGGLWKNASDSDKFTSNKQTGAKKVGNQQLKYPIALMTADEIVYAGGTISEVNENTYYYKNNQGGSAAEFWWTMSPVNNYSMFGVDHLGLLIAGDDLSLSKQVRPVVSLKSCVSISGSGKTDDPYIPSVDAACAASDN